MYHWSSGRDDNEKVGAGSTSGFPVTMRGLDANSGTIGNVEMELFASDTLTYEDIETSLNGLLSNLEEKEIEISSDLQVMVDVGIITLEQAIGMMS